MLPTPEQTAELIQNRRTIHAFKPEKPDATAVADAIELIRWAPNHRFTEPWRVYMLGEETTKDVLELSERLVREKRGDEAADSKREKWNAVPQWLVVTQHLAGDELQRQEDYAACATAIQNLQLYLWSAGIGVKWTSGPVIRSAEFLELLWADPATEQAVGLLQVGYPKEVPNIPRKPVADYLISLP